MQNISHGTSTRDRIYILSLPGKGVGKYGSKNVVHPIIMSPTFL